VVNSVPIKLGLGVGIRPRNTGRPTTGNKLDWTLADTDVFIEEMNIPFKIFFFPFSFYYGVDAYWWN
jgi:hypothetical protein